MKVFLALLGLASFAVANASPNLIINGDFETHGPFNHSSNGIPWGFYNTLTGWTINNGPAEIGMSATYGIRTVNGQSSAVAELDSSRNYALSQSLSGLTTGRKYTLSFDYARRNNVAVNSCLFNLGVNGHIVSMSPTSTQMTTYMTTFTAVSGSNIISFAGAGKSDSYGAVIDNVSVVSQPAATPEPITMGFVAVGAISAIRRRNRK